ncbi:MAG TPA: DUF58 domain-containing protein [Planctomycetaceae bacterium]|nr:DUF58 domain-containing protein [Planctomycetaceae bacterium]
MKQFAAGIAAGAAINDTGHDPSALMRIKNLQLRARSVVEGFYNGLHRSPFHGFSVEFSEYRPYTFGDDPRGLDWKLYARTDRYYIKRFEDETNRHVYLLLDRSRSMGFGSLEYNKSQYAVTLAATMAYFFSLQRDSVGLLTFDESIGDFIPARQRPGHFRQLMVALSRPLSGKDTNLDSPLQQIAQLISKRGLVILISDLLAPIDTLRTNLGLLRSRGHEVMLLRTIDPGELKLSITQATMVIDMETGREMYLDPVEAADAYERNFTAHRDQVTNICQSLGVDLFEMQTNEPLADSLMHIVSTQKQRGGRSARRGMVAGGAKGGGT